MISCGVFDSLHPNRKQLLWAVAGMAARPSNPASPNLSLSLMDNLESLPQVPDFSSQEKFNMEYEVLGIDIRNHYISHWRDRLNSRGFISSKNLSQAKEGSQVKIAGIPIRPHRPPTRTGKIAAFFSLEDEFGLMDITVFEKTYQTFGALLFTKPVLPLAVSGRLQRRGNSAAVIAYKIEALR